MHGAHYFHPLAPNIYKTTKPSIHFLDLFDPIGSREVYITVIQIALNGLIFSLTPLHRRCHCAILLPLGVEWQTGASAQ
jgi:hypothetical protein